jgi:hypothetical protein
VHWQQCYSQRGMAEGEQLLRWQQRQRHRQQQQQQQPARRAKNDFWLPAPAVNPAPVMQALAESTQSQPQPPLPPLRPHHELVYGILTTSWHQAQLLQPIC